MTIRKNRGDVSAAKAQFDKRLLAAFVDAHASLPLPGPDPLVTCVEDVFRNLAILADPSEPARFRVFLQTVGQGSYEWTPGGWLALTFDFIPLFETFYGKDGKTVTHPVALHSRDSNAPNLTSFEGVFFLINPIDGRIHFNPRRRRNSSRSLESCTSFAFAVLESDVADGNQWLQLVPLLPFPVVMVVSSGGSSYHILVYIGAKSEAQWHARIDPAKQALARLGADQNTFRCVQLSRLPFCFRGEKGNQQRLIYFNSKPALFESSYRSVEAFDAKVKEIAQKLGIQEEPERRLPASEISSWDQTKRPHTAAVKYYELERQAAGLVMREFRKQLREKGFIDFKRVAEISATPFNNEDKVKYLYDFYSDQFNPLPPFPPSVFHKIWDALRQKQGEKVGLKSSTRKRQSGSEIFKNLAHSYTALRDKNKYGEEALEYLLSENEHVKGFSELWKTVCEIVRDIVASDPSIDPETAPRNFIRVDLAHCEALFAFDEPSVLAMVKAAVYLLVTDGDKFLKDGVCRLENGDMKITMKALLYILPFSDETIRHWMSLLVNERYEIRRVVNGRDSHWVVPKSFADLWRKENPYINPAPLIGSLQTRPKAADLSALSSVPQVAIAGEAKDMHDDFGGLLPPLKPELLGSLTKLLGRDEVIRRISSVVGSLEPRYKGDE